MNLKQLISEAATKHNIREDILAALVWQESRGNPLAVRYEPKFFMTYMQNKKLPAELSGYCPKGIPTFITEKMLRSTSFGLCQVMGETLRSYLGAKAQYLSAYFDPELNIDAGARYLAHLLSRCDGDYAKALRLYNGSSAYPAIIFDHVQKKPYLALYD